MGADRPASRNHAGVVLEVAPDDRQRLVGPEFGPQPRDVVSDLLVLDDTVFASLRCERFYVRSIQAVPAEGRLGSWLGAQPLVVNPSW